MAQKDAFELIQSLHNCDRDRDRDRDSERTEPEIVTQ
jgi:hypothetical protein